MGGKVFHKLKVLEMHDLWDRVCGLGSETGLGVSGFYTS